MQHGFVRVSPVFIINGQSPEVLEPGESALYNPSFGMGRNLSVCLSDLSTTSRSQRSSLLTVFLTASPL